MFICLLLENNLKFIDSPLNLLARVLNTAANFPIDSLVLFSNCNLDVLANFVSKLYVQHVADDDSQYLRFASGNK